MKHRAVICFFGVLMSLFMTHAVVVPTAKATPYCHSCPMDCGLLGLGKKECSQISSSGGVCCVDLNKYGLEVAKAREAVAPTAPPRTSSQNKFPEQVL